MRISLIECTLSEVQQRAYKSERKLKLICLFDETNICDQKIDFLKEKNKEVKDRRDKVDTKARTLLTLTSLLLGLISSTTSIVSIKSIGFCSIFPLTLLFLTIFLLTIYFGIDNTQTTDYSYIFLDSKSDSTKKMLCNDLLEAQDYNHRATNFMIDLYRAALRYFSLAMLFIMVLGIGNIIFTNGLYSNAKPNASLIPFVDVLPKILKTTPSVPSLPSQV